MDDIDVRVGRRSDSWEDRREDIKPSEWMTLKPVNRRTAWKTSDSAEPSDPVRIERKDFRIILVPMILATITHSIAKLTTDQIAHELLYLVALVFLLLPGYYAVRYLFASFALKLTFTVLAVITILNQLVNACEEMPYLNSLVLFTRGSLENEVTKAVLMTLLVFFGMVFCYFAVFLLSKSQQKLERTRSNLEQENVERQRMENAWKQSEEKFTSLILSSSDLFLILNSEGLIQYTSPSAQTMLGVDDETELIKTNFLGLITSQDKPEAQRLLKESVEQSEIEVSGELCVSRRDGSSRSLEITLQNLLCNISVAGIVVNARDITQRKELETQLRQSQKMEAIGQLAGGVAHDFNNILTTISGNTELALASLHSDSPIAENMKEVHTAADRARMLTKQLLAFGRKEVIQPQVLNLNEIVENMKRMLQRLIGENIDLITVSDSRSGLVKVDPGQIQQVIMNLVVNARDSMPEGGKLRIQTRDFDTDHDLSALPTPVVPGSYVILEVHDTGFGMDEHTQEQIFEPFFTTKHESQGSGLGLPIIYGIVTQNRGHIRISSEPAKGTSVQVFLRHSETHKPPIRQLTEAVSIEAGTETVLLVEDDRAVRSLARRVLNANGYTVLDAADGNEAIEISGRSVQPIKLLITDVIMPGMNGRELAEHLLEHDSGLKVLYMSGHTDDIILRHRIAEEAYNFLPKPFTTRQLLEKVNLLLRPS